MQIVWQTFHGKTTFKGTEMESEAVYTLCMAQIKALKECIKIKKLSED